MLRVVGQKDVQNYGFFCIYLRSRFFFYTFAQNFQLKTILYDMLRHILTFILFILFSCTTDCSAQRLFHISRSVNKNWVCYDVNQKNNVLDIKNPIHVYWHNNTDNPGHENELSFFQRKMAYGYNVINKGKNEVEVKLTAYKKRSMKVRRQNGKWMCVVNINNKQCQLKEIQVKTKEGNPLHVLYINLLGTALSDGSAQKEKIVNS